MEHDGGNAKRRAIAELEKTGVRLKLLKFARWRTGSDADAADLLQSALAKVFDPNDSPWDPTKGASFFLHVGSIVNGLAANARRSWQAQHEVLEAGLARDHDTVDGAPLADEALDAHRELASLRRRGGLLLAELDRDAPVTANVFRAALDGAEGHAEIAAKVGCRVDEVRYAYDRIKYHARRILEREREAELRRMSDLRERSPAARAKEGAG